MTIRILFLSVILSGCASVGGFSDALGAAYLTADSLAVTVSELCGQAEARGDCVDGAPLSTAQKELARARLLEALEALDTARLLYAEGSADIAGDRLQEARRLLSVVEGLLRRYE